MRRPLDFLKHQVNGKNFKELLITPEKEQFYYLVIYKVKRTYANMRRQHLLLKNNGENGRLLDLDDKKSSK